MPGSNWFMRMRLRTRVALVAATMVLFLYVQMASAIQSGLRIKAEKIWPVAVASGSRVHWRDFAYVQYVTDANYLCNAVMMVEALHRLGAKADRLVMYPEDWDEELLKPDSLLVQATDTYKAKLVPIKLQSFEKEKDHGDTTWRDSYTKLLAFNQTQYKRVLSLDSDATVQQHMDELFLLPPVSLALPRAYWLPQPFLSSQLLLITPSTYEWSRIETLISRPDSGYDMDILNTLYKDSSLVLPHRPYNMLSGEFRSDSHERYLGSQREVWNAERISKEAKYIHFSDWPVPKPWLQTHPSVMDAHRPNCTFVEDGKEDCGDREVWEGLYRDFGDRRERICGQRYAEANAPQVER